MTMIFKKIYKIIILSKDKYDNIKILIGKWVQKSKDQWQKIWIWWIASLKKAIDLLIWNKDFLNQIINSIGASIQVLLKTIVNIISSIFRLLQINTSLSNLFQAESTHLIVHKSRQSFQIINFHFRTATHYSLKINI